MLQMVGTPRLELKPASDALVVMLALDGHAEELPGVLDEPEELVARFAALEG